MTSPVQLFILACVYIKANREFGGRRGDMAERSWLGGRRSEEEEGAGRESGGGRVGDPGVGGGHREAFGMLVETKFRQLDTDEEDRLNVWELRPAVADIGAALGLPEQGASPNADHIYSEVMSELTHGTSQGEASKAEFKKALSDILLGMAAGLKRDPIVILRMDGEDLKDFVGSGRYEPEAAIIFSGVGGGRDASLRQSLLAALQQLTVDHGMPPASDAWVVGNIIEPALLHLPADQLHQPASREGFFDQLKKLLGAVAERIEEQPVIVAHTENTFDGNGITRLLANKFELDKLLDSVWKDVPAEQKNKASKAYLRVALDKMADAARLPPCGAVTKVDAAVDDAIKTANADHGKAVDQAEFKKLLTAILGAVMLQRNKKPVFVSTNTVVHGPLCSSSTMTAAPSE